MKIFFAVFVVLCGPLASAVELYSIFDSKCSEKRGYIIRSTTDHFELLTIDGKNIVLKNKDLRGVLVYNFVNPPLGKIRKNQRNLRSVKSISVSDGEIINTFLGYPIQFIEELVVFLGVDGKVRVHNLDNVLKIRPYKEGKFPAKHTSSPTLNVLSKDYVQSCPGKGTSGKVRPNRILVDRIKIQQFLRNYSRGYEALTSFEERTYLYARPKIYNQKTMFGLNFIGDEVEQSSATLLGLDGVPFITWSSGRPYRVQSLIELGNIYNEYGADLDPIIGFKSEVKAHFFHAVFIGNFMGIEAGTSFFIKNEPDLISNSTYDSGLNYSILLGGDLGKHSISAGLYYPVFFIKIGDEVREVLSTKTSYAIRYMYTSKLARFYVVGSIKSESSDNPTEENVILQGPTTSLTNLEIDSFFLRGGVDFTLPSETRLGANFLVMDSSYKENNGSGSSSLTRLGASVHVRRAFGDYVSFGARINYLLDDVEGQLGAESFENSENRFGFSFNGALIF